MIVLVDCVLYGSVFLYIAKQHAFRVAVMFQSDLVMSKRSTPRWACVVDGGLVGYVFIRTKINSNLSALQCFSRAI